MVARYVGVPLVELLADGGNIKLKSELTFYDPQGVRWSVPPGAVVDGASIPSAFWPIIGSPLTGLYRDASIIHDWFCDKRTRTWWATHRVFYDAMIVSGVSRVHAKIMYFAVRWRGPRWEERVTLNTTLDPGERYNFERAGTARPSGSITRTVVAVPSPGHSAAAEEQQRVVDAILARIENEDPSLTEIESLAERMISDQT